MHHNLFQDFHNQEILPKNQFPHRSTLFPINRLRFLRQDVIRNTLKINPRLQCVLSHVTSEPALLHPSKGNAAVDPTPHVDRDHA